MKRFLITSAPSLASIQKAVRRYWGSDAYGVDPRTLEITHPHRIVPPRYRVVHNGDHYRFEG